MADEIEAGDAEEFDFDPDEGCTFGCELPARFGLPCRHWMYASVVEECPLPLSLFHPRWLFDGPAVLHERWVMSWDPELMPALGPSLADRHAGDRYAAQGQQMVEESALAVFDKLKRLPPGMKESFAKAFAKGAESLLAQQESMLASQEAFPPTLPEPLVEETPLQFRRGKRRAMTGLEIAEERERDASRQRRRDERSAAALAAADCRAEAQEKERQEEEGILAANWVADTQLQLSQLLYNNDGEADDDQRLHSPLSLGLSDNPQETEPGSQAQPLEVSSDSEVSRTSDADDDEEEPRRSGRVKKPTAVVESQQWQIEHGLIPAPGAKGKARALNAKKKKNAETSQLENEFRLSE
jgi:hypothetical protein